MPLVGVTANVMLFWPVFPSVNDVELTAISGVESSSMIVPMPSAFVMGALIGFESLTVNVSLFSFVVSPLMSIVMVLETSPAAKINVPDCET